MGKKDEVSHACAAHWKPILESIDGFIDNERFESKRREEMDAVAFHMAKRDEKAVVRWRIQSEHHSTQEKGRNGMFLDYHLRVCEVTFDSHPPAGLQVVEQRLDATAIGEAKALGITEVLPPSHLVSDVRAEGLVDHDVFESIYNPGKMVLLTSWKTAEDCARWAPNSFAGGTKLRHRRVRNVRDYGMFPGSAGKRRSIIRKWIQPMQFVLSLSFRRWR